MFKEEAKRTQHCFQCVLNTLGHMKSTVKVNIIQGHSIFHGWMVVIKETTYFFGLLRAPNDTFKRTFMQVYTVWTVWILNLAET